MERQSAALPCVTRPAQHLNRQYSYAETYGVEEWVCPSCCARWILLPTTQEARAAHYIMEVAIHEGNFTRGRFEGGALVVYSGFLRLTCMAKVPP